MLEAAVVPGVEHQPGKYPSDEEKHIQLGAFYAGVVSSSNQSESGGLPSKCHLHPFGYVFSSCELVTGGLIFPHSIRVFECSNEITLVFGRG